MTPIILLYNIAFRSIWIHKKLNAIGWWLLGMFKMSLCTCYIMYCTWYIQSFTDNQHLLLLLIAVINVNPFMLQPASGQQCQYCFGDHIMPYKLELLKRWECTMCGQQRRYCDCDQDEHIDPSKPHRSDLCGMCSMGIFCRSAIM